MKTFRSLLALLVVPTLAACSSSDEDSTPTETTAAALEAGCQAYAEATLSKSAECPLFVEDLGTDPEVVARMARTCKSLFGAPGSGASRAKLEACAEATTAASCLTFHGGIEECEPLFYGTLAPREACLFDTQCETGKCLGSTGASCGQCAWQANIGEACGAGLADVPCKDDLVCLQTTGTSGTCERVEATELFAYTVGASCTGNDCGPNSWLTCVAGACVELGSKCDDGSDCRAGQRCDTTSKSCVTAVLAKVGEACGYQSSAPYLTIECDAGLHCDLDSHTCRSRIQENGPCVSGKAPCAEGLTCIDGRCIVPEIAEYACGGSDQPKSGFSLP